MTIVIIVLAAWNVFTFLLYGADKAKAKRGAWRVSEKTLLLCAALFGAAGALCGMELFRHKTRHKSFTVSVPIFLVIQLALAYFAYVKWA